MSNRTQKPKAIISFLERIDSSSFAEIGSEEWKDRFISECNLHDKERKIIDHICSINSEKIEIIKEIIHCKFFSVETILTEEGCNKLISDLEEFDKTSESLTDEYSEHEIESSEFDIQYKKFIEAMKIENSFAQRIGQNFVYTYNFEKTNKLEKVENAKICGLAAKVAGKTDGKPVCIENLADVDFDQKKYNKKWMSISQRHGYNKIYILSKCPKNFVVIESGNVGIQIPCNLDEMKDELWSNCEVKALKLKFITETGAPHVYDIDLIGAVKPGSQRLITLPGTTIKTECEIPTDQYNTYKFLQGGWDSVIDYSMKDVLDVFGLVHEKKVRKKCKISHFQKKICDGARGKDCPDKSFDPKLQKALVDGLSSENLDVEIHAHTHSGKSMDDEVTLMILFQAFNCLDDEFAQQAYRNLKNNCNLTDNARDRWKEKRNENDDKRSTPFVLVKLFKLYGHEYYKNYIEKLLKKHVSSLVFHPFDILKDNFTVEDVIKRADDCAYDQDVKTAAEAIDRCASDLSKVYRWVVQGKSCFVEKTLDGDVMRISFLRKDDVKEKLDSIPIYFEEKKIYTIWDALKSRLAKFTINAVRFNSEIDKVVNIFQGWRYKRLKSVNMEKISEYLDLIKEIIATGDKEVYEYLLNWMAFIAQNPGKKTRVAIILKGMQGTGKNTFTDVLAQLFSPHSQPNMTKLDELVGTFNSGIENSVLIVCNEMQTVKDEYVSNMDSLKSLITDAIIRINEKYQPRRTADNVANFIFVSNHEKPIIVPVDDRRYLVLNVSAKYRNEFKKWNSLHNLDSEFYDNLLTFLLNRDISNWNANEDLPITQAKKNLQYASMNTTDCWILEHFDDLVSGMEASDVKYCAPPTSEIKRKTFRSQLLEKCDLERPRLLDGRRPEVYKLKPEWIEKFDTLVVRNSEETNDLDDLISKWIAKNIEILKLGMFESEVMNDAPTDELPLTLFLVELSKKCILETVDSKLRFRIV